MLKMRMCRACWWFFFFQAEDGIRDSSVTGVQTCALPICFSVILEDPATRRHDNHAETVEDADVTGFVHGIDDGMGPLNINCDLCVRRNVDALELKQQPTHGHCALHPGRGFPDCLSALCV